MQRYEEKLSQKASSSVSDDKVADTIPSLLFLCGKHTFVENLVRQRKRCGKREKKNLLAHIFVAFHKS